MVHLGDFFRKIPLCIGLLFCLIWSNSLYAQVDLEDEEEVKPALDTEMVMSPLYMPVDYDYIEPHFYHTLKSYPVDTSVVKIHQYDPIWQDDNIYQTLGIGAQAHKAMNFDFKKKPGFSAITFPYPLFFKQQEDLQYYDLKTSFTRLAYTYGISAENEFDATHAQHRGNLVAVANIHGYTNTGYFTHQKANNIQVDALVHYEIPSRIYGFRVSYIFNRVKLEENAGLLYREDFENQIAQNLMGYNMKLYNANSLINTHDLLFQHYVNIKDKKGHYFGTITHSLQYKKVRSRYLDTNLDTLYYRGRFYLAEDSTKDSVHCHQLVNTVQWSNFSPFDKESNKNYFFHIAGGIMHEYVENRIPEMRQRILVEYIENDLTPWLSFPDSMYGTRSQHYYRCNLLTPFARTHIRLFGVMDINAGISYTLMGYNRNEAIANAKVSWAISRKNSHYIALDAHFYRVSPDYILSYYAGNHVMWNNEWRKQNIMKLTASWQRKGCIAEVSYFMLQHYVQLNENWMPYVTDKTINMMQIHLSAPLRIKGFGANANIYVQYCDNENLPLPIFAGKASAYYVFKVFQNKMKLQIGLDLMYNTAYYADAYSPLLHQFYHQTSQKVGNFLYVNANLNIQVQRIGIFCRLGNFLAGVLGFHYFTTPDYPMQNLRVAIGINWRFYD